MKVHMTKYMTKYVTKYMTKYMTSQHDKNLPAVPASKAEEDRAAPVGIKIIVHHSDMMRKK
jgi:hypothetical protein